MLTHKYEDLIVQVLGEEFARSIDREIMEGAQEHGLLPANGALELNALDADLFRTYLDVVTDTVRVSTTQPPLGILHHWSGSSSPSSSSGTSSGRKRRRRKKAKKNVPTPTVRVIRFLKDKSPA